MKVQLAIKNNHVVKTVIYAKMEFVKNVQKAFHLIQLFNYATVKVLDNQQKFLMQLCQIKSRLNFIIVLQSSHPIQYVQSYDEYTLLDLVVNEYAFYCELWQDQIYQENKFEVYKQNCQCIQENEQIEQLNYYDISIVIYQFCDSNCLFCNFGICSLCLKGSYIFNNECLQRDIVEYYQNELVCGDKIVQMGEICDDGNQIEYDGCFQCQFSCDQYCLKCELGTCLNCQEGFILNFQTCEPYCGDGLVIPFTKEECDDNNEFQADGCDLCKFECISNCLKCNSYTIHCFKCEKGFENKNEICIAICGDGIVIPEFEACDDSNNIMYDGCFDCQYQCSQDCQECSKGICQLSCKNNRIAVDGICLNLCGKLMVSYDLECDDNNDIDYDGCFECKFKCEIDCHTCDKGICIQCNPGYQLYKQQCYFQDREETSSSNVENQNNNWICKGFECAYSESPKLQLSNLGLKNQQYKIKIQFNQEVSCAQTECQEIFNIYFKEIEGDFYKVSCSPFEDQGFTKHTSWVEYYQFKFNLKKLSQVYNIQLQLNYSIQFQQSQLQFLNLYQKSLQHNPKF